MPFWKPKPTVTPDDRHWVEDAFCWFEQTYSRDFLKSVRTLEPTKQFFPLDFAGTEENADALTGMICDYMKIKGAAIDLYYFSDQPLQLDEGIVTTQAGTGARQRNDNVLGTYSESGPGRYSIGIELNLLKNPMSLIATLAHELSHLALLGEGRLEDNDEELTDLNCIAMGFGVFTCNSIFNFTQWQGASHQGWQAQRHGYIPEQVATYALALLTHYQGQSYDEWVDFLNPSPRKMFEKNMAYLTTTSDEIKFR